jgi:dihydroorotate dehydrogenase (fumarate)
MADLSTTYMGLELQNPLVVASCSLSKTIDGVRTCADAGAGAIVLKSLFEEQIWGEMENTGQFTGALWHSEAIEYIENMGMALGPKGYLALIEEAKRTVSIPIIASLNCVSPKVWLDYTKRIVNAGADALELNISPMPSDPKRGSEEVEELLYQIAEAVVQSVDIPIAVKIGPYITAVAKIARELEMRGASALVLFNRFYQIDIDIEKLELAPGYKFSAPFEIAVPLRWITLLAGRTELDLAASTGIHDSAGVIKQLLAGATIVQLCSTLYLNGVKHIASIREGLEQWMAGHNFDTIDQFRGKLSQKESDKPELYERMQYIKALVGID